MYDNVLEVGRFPSILYEWSGEVTGSGDRLWVKLKRSVDLAWRDSHAAGFGPKSASWETCCAPPEIFW